MLAAIVSLSVVPTAERALATAAKGTGPAFKSIGPMTFGPDGALYFTMGHKLPGMASEYAKNIQPDRLVAVAQTVHDWLWPKSRSKAVE